MLADAYRPGRGPLYAMDPRAKTILVAAVGIHSVLPTSLLTAAVLPGVLLLVCLATLGPREALRPLRAALPLLLMLCLLTPLFYPQGSLLIGVRGLRLLTDRGAAETLRLLCRLVTLTMAFFAYFRTTELGALLESGRWFGLPFSACLVLGVAVRLVPSTAALYLGVLDAHSLRRPSAATRRRGPAAEVRRIAPAVTAVLVHSVKSIPVLSMALETRGVGRANRRSSTVRLGPVRRMLLHLALGAAVPGLPCAALLLL